MCCRFVLVLLFMCVADNEARVVKSFEGECSQFCYKKRCPLFGLRFVFQNTFHKICQQYKGQDYFATLYLPMYRIPLYAAYRLDEFECKNTQKSRLKQWFIEPQLSNVDIPYMSTDDGSGGYWRKQAVTDHYRYTGYDRGHLNPCFYQCDNARTATFTLTNVVPQEPSFNQRLWFAMETMSKQIMRDQCNSHDNDKRFFVTGVIPSRKFIPVLRPHEEDNFKVNVPIAMWTAACCQSSNDKDSFSFSYVGFNGPNSYFYVMSIPELLEFLSFYWFNVQIFSKDCFPGNYKSTIAYNMLVNASNAHTNAKKTLLSF